MTAEAVVEVRLSLHAAHAARAEALAILDAARAAVERARQFAVAARDRCAAVEEETRDLAVDVSIAVRNAIIEGRTPMFESTPTLTANALAEREFAHRALVAEIAQGDLEAAAGEAQVAATSAEDEVRACAEALMLAEGTAIAEQVAALDAQALALRVRLGGGAFAPIAVRGQPLSPVLAKILRETDELGLDVSSRTLMEHSYRVIRRMRYGTGSTRERHNDRGDPSSDTT